MQTTKLKSTLIFLSLFLGIDVLQAGQSPCELVRAAFDIGSGSTKMKVAKIDRCQKRILSYITDKSLPVPYKEDLKGQDKGNARFSALIMDKGLNALLVLKKQAQALGATDFRAVATSAFRTAKNAPQFVEKIKAKLDIPIHIIDQQTEAKLGHMAVLATKEFPRKNLMVWDIGGGSMQMTLTDQNGKLQTFKGDLASVTFKNAIIKDILKKDPTKITSPNPLGIINAHKAKEMAVNWAKTNIPAQFQEQLKNAPKEVVGIGGVHFYSVRNQTKKKKKTGYSLADVKNAYSKRVKLNDKKIGGAYAETDVSNLGLVLGFMEALNITQVMPLKINMADGILLFF